MLGATVPAIGGYHMGFKVGDEWGCDCIQIYITPSRTWNVSKLSQDEIIKFKTTWKESKVKEVVAHIPYLVNLASSDEILWNKSINRLKTELSRADKFGVSLLVLHPGSYVNPVKCRKAAIPLLLRRGLFNRVNSTKQEGSMSALRSPLCFASRKRFARGIKRIILALNKVLEKYNGKAKILLETMAGQGTMIGSNFEEIAYILSKVNRPQSGGEDKSSPSRFADACVLGVCFDTAHVFMAGYDIRSTKGYEKVLSEFDKIIGIEKIRAIHLNDSKTDLGSRVDRHAFIGEGKIGLEMFQAIIKDKRFKDIPKILENPGRETRSVSPSPPAKDTKTKDNLELLRKLK